MKVKPQLLCLYFLVLVASAFGGIAFAYDDSGYPHNVTSGCTATCYPDENGFCKNNCTSYCAYMLNRVYGIGDFGNSYLQPSGSSWSHGGNWADAARRAGIEVDRNPLPGDIAWWDYDWTGDPNNHGDDWGHVAFVEKVYYDANGNVTGIDVTEYNATSEGCRFSQRLNISANNPSAFIHILAFNEGVVSLHYLNCQEMVCPGQTSDEWDRIAYRVWTEYRCVGDDCNSQYDLAYINSIASGFGGGTPVPTPTPDPTTNPPNLKVREIKVYDANGTLLTERETVLIPGEVLDIRINIISLEENCSNGMEAGKDTVETDIYYKIALGDDLGSYQYLGRVYSEVWRLTEDNHHIEHFSYTVPTSAAGQRIYFRAKVDATSEVTETDEDDNYSGTDEWYAVEGDCDIIITKVALTNGKTALNEGEHYGIEAFVKNQGTTTCPFSTRLVYYEQRPGQTTWTEMATDGTDVAELVPGFIKHEYTTGEPFVANTPGIHNLMACGDYLKDQPETNETNNCATASFMVSSNKPNFYIHKAYFKVGSTTYQAGATIPKNSYIKPYVQIGNDGTSSLHGAFRVAYYVNADKYRDSDGVDANQVCVGCIVTEYVSTGFKLGDTGTRTYRVCIDYEGKVAESNEADNCQTITFYVR